MVRSGVEVSKVHIRLTMDCSRQLAGWQVDMFVDGSPAILLVCIIPGASACFGRALVPHLQDQAGGRLKHVAPTRKIASMACSPRPTLICADM